MIKIAILGYETEVLFEKIYRSCIWTLFLAQGVKLSLFSLYGQRSPRHGPIFKLDIFGHGTWPSATDPEIAHILPELPQSPNFTPFFSTAGHFQDMGNFAFIFPLGTILNFNLFKRFYLKFQISKKQVLCGLLQGTFRKGRNSIKTV